MYAYVVEPEPPTDSPVYEVKGNNRVPIVRATPDAAAVQFTLSVIALPPPFTFVITAPAGTPAPETDIPIAREVVDDIEVMIALPVAVVPVYEYSVTPFVSVGESTNDI